MSLTREGRDYLIIGIGQWLLDWGVMVILSHFGVPVRAANVVGRTCAALAGFWLNGKITFRARGARMGGVQLLRFLVLWLGTTVVGTWAIGWVDDLGGLHAAWLAKPLIELIIAAIGFIVSRHWVYRG